MSSSQDFLTTRQFAQKAGVSTSTVSKWLRTEKIKGRKKGGKWIISANEISNVLTSSPTKTAAEPDTKETATTNAPKPGANVKSYTIKEFSDLTYLTEFGVKKWLKEGRLAAAADVTGEARVDASNLEIPTFRRLVR